MRVWLVAVPVCLLGACSGDGNDVTGPFTGESRRFVVDAVRVPRDGSEAMQLAADLDGDGAPENAFGNVTGVLGTTNDLSTHAADMIASGALASTVTIQADDLTDDDSVGVTYHGADGEPATVAGGRFVGGAFVSNRTRETRVPGRARVHLPVYVNADPLALDLEGMELELTADGSGGYDGIVRGGFREEDAREAAYLGLLQMFETEPERHIVFERGIDADHDDVITRAEVDDSVIALLVSADIALFDGDRYAPRTDAPADSLSVAFGIHLAPCAEGRCSSAVPENGCRDRLRDGDETDVDCGGSCQACAGGKQCTIAADCQSQACDAGTCRAASCSDGVRDGYESDIDCGGSCGPCMTGRACAVDADCASNNCSAGIASLGSCQ
ncbi:MAG TPA: hypothetical protein VFS15_27170 [Kofleriaceae bacterium]|nr:hypothetical protein [Kofleriaceae bacterium]